MRAVVSLLAFSSLFLFGASSSVFAAIDTAKCNNPTGITPDKCQYTVTQDEEAPKYNESMGIRLNGGVKHVLFNSYPGLYRYVSKADSTSDIFVPQASPDEFRDFLKSAPNINITWAYAVPDMTYDYSGRAASFANCAGSVFLVDTSTNGSKSTVLVPGASTTTPHPLTTPTSGYGFLTNGSASTVTVGSTALNSIIQFKYNRQNQSQDCIYDNEENESCASVVFIQNQSIPFKTAPGAANSVGFSDYIWMPEAGTSALHVSLNNGTPTAVDDCSASYSSSAPVIKGACGGAQTDGLALTAAPAAAIPSTYLCAKGNISSAGVMGNGPWTWTCNAVGTGAVAADNATCSAGGQGCPTSTAVSWKVGDYSCNGSTSSVTSSGSITSPAVTATGVNNGTASFKCNAGTLAVQTGATCAISMCPASSYVSWSGNASCAGYTSSVTNSGSTTSVSSSNGNLGSATFACTSGNLSYQSGSCNAPASCSGSSYVGWSSGSTSCAGYTSSTIASGSSIYVSSSGSNTGGATFGCSNGSLYVQSVSSCYTPAPPPPPVGCPGYSLQSWNVGGVACSGYTGPNAVSSGGMATATSQGQSTKGHGYYQCYNGTYYYQSGDCHVPVGCGATSVSWSGCSGTTSATGHATTTSVTSSNGDPGSATYSCYDGVLSYSSGSCTPMCSAGNIPWCNQSGIPDYRVCSGYISATPVGSSVTVTATSGGTGSQIFTCGSLGWIGGGSGICKQ